MSPSETKVTEKPEDSGVVGAAPMVGPRRVRLTLNRIDPWSVMKMSFLLSIALGIITVVAVTVIWLVLNGMGVFTSIARLLAEFETDSDPVDYVSFGRVVSITTIIAVVDVILFTALATVGAVIYNMAAGLVGGFFVTLSDEQ